MRGLEFHPQIDLTDPLLVNLQKSKDKPPR